VTAELMITGGSPLAGALRCAAARAGCRLSVRDDGADGPAALTRKSSDGRTATVILPGQEELPWLVTARTLGVMTRAWQPSPLRVSCVTLSPAAGVCGPAAAGPVDSVRIGGTRELAAGPVPVSVQVLTIQHTRCWILCCAVYPPGGARIGLRPVPGVILVNGAIAADSARATEFMHDRDSDGSWPEILVLGSPRGAENGSSHAVLAVTEGGLARDLVDEVLVDVAGRGDDR
jgi:hypothetical protein